MPRLPRLNIPNIPQHVIQRGNNRQACFFDDADHEFYLDKLKDYAKKYKEYQGVRVLDFLLFMSELLYLVA